MTSIPELVSRVGAFISRARRAHPLLDRVLSIQDHYGKVGASQQAGAVTYFGFLSVFPILALAFFVVGWIARVYPDAQKDLVKAIGNVLPGLVGTGKGQVSLKQITDAAGAAGIIGAVGLLYAGLGWISALRTALIDVFEVPKKEQPNWIMAKLRDLVALITLGVILLVAVAFSGLVTRGVVGPIVSVVAGLAADTVLFFAMFMLLARPRLARRALWQGALLGGVGFEILKQLSRWLLSHTQGTPAFQVFGVSLILLVWINYFTRVTFYAASYAVTALPAETPGPALVQGPSSPRLEIPGTPGAPATSPTLSPLAFVAAGVGALAGFLVGRRRA